MFGTMADKHWYYPSTIIGCGLSIDGLTADELACLRSTVTCPSCIARIRADKEICQACKLGAPEVVPSYEAPPHVCDPALA
jgi:hypothetical protein